MNHIQQLKASVVDFALETILKCGPLHDVAY